MVGLLRTLVMDAPERQIVFESYKSASERSKKSA